MSFTHEQKQHVIKQLEAHDRDSGIRTIVLDEKSKESINLEIDRGVFGSDIMSSGLYLARFLFSHKALYEKKEVLDMGCGPGLQ